MRFAEGIAVAPPELNPPAAGPMVPERFRVTRVSQETPDTFRLTLQRWDGAGPSRFRPGQFSMLWVFGVGELPISICGDPAVDDRLEYTVRSVGPATHALVRLSVGDAIGVRGPLGVGWPVEACRGRDVILVAGGIGLAPLRPVIREVLGDRRAYGRLVLLYGARSPRELLYRKELASWARQPDMQVLVTVDYGGVAWHGHVGLVTTLFKYARLQPRRSVAMVCGPEIMMRSAARELEAQGLARPDVYLSLERNMKCGIGHCGHCQYGDWFACKDGPVFPYGRIHSLLEIHEL